jgi:hypothetical protein
MNTATVTRTAQHASPAREYARDRLFYSGMAIAMGLTVFVGFGSSYYLRFLSSGPGTTVSGGPFTPLVHLHGVLFTAWVLLFIVQTALVAVRRVVVHRRLGVATAVLAALMVVVGTSTAIATASRGGAPPGVDPLVFLVIPMFDMLLFATFVTFAVVKRRDREAHKRLMLLAYVSIIVAAVARLPGVLLLGPLAFFGLAFLFILMGGLYDFLSKGRVHRVYVWGGALFAISVPVRLMISGTSAWRAFAELLTS